MRPRSNRAFLRFWFGRSVGFFGAEVSLEALPLTAISILHATPLQMGMLGAAENLPYLFFGLLAGVWVDRHPRIPMLAATDMLRAIGIASIPLALLAGLLRMELLYAAVFLVGSATVLGMVTNQSLLPTLVDRRDLLTSNRKLELTNSIADSAGPSIGGFLVQWLSAPFALFFDAAASVLSAITLLTLKTSEPPRPGYSKEAKVTQEIIDGLHAVLGNKVLRVLTLCACFDNIIEAGVFAPLFILYAYQELGINAVTIGFIIAAEGAGALLGAFMTVKITRRTGIFGAIKLVFMVSFLARLLLTCVQGPMLMVVSVLMTAEFMIGFGRSLFNSNFVSLRQLLSPEQMLGRVNATVRFVMWAAIPLGSLGAGLLAQYLGLRITLLTAACATIVPTLGMWLLSKSPLATNFDKEIREQLRD